MKATEKQLEFIRSIENALGYEFDYKHSTRAEAARYISSHIAEYNIFRVQNEIIYEHYNE